MQTKLIFISAFAAVNAAMAYQGQNYHALRTVAVAAAAVAPAIVNAAPAMDSKDTLTPNKKRLITTDLTDEQRNNGIFDPFDDLANNLDEIF